MKKIFLLLFITILAISLIGVGSMAITALNTISGEIISQALNDNFSHVAEEVNMHLADIAKYTINVTNPPTPLEPLLLDGTDEVAKLQAIVDYLDALGGGVLLIPSIAPVSIGSTLVMPNSPITIKGTGRYETGKGSRMQWIGGNDDSVIEINAYNQIKDLFIYNGNASTGVIGIDAKGAFGGRAPRYLIFANIHVKGFDKGYIFSYSYYNEFRSIFASYCNVGYEIGLETNNTDFYACHANVCGKGVNLIAGSRQVLWSGCSFENNTDVAIDLGTATFAYNWAIDNPYFEGNRQTIKARGFVKMDNAFINGDWIDVVENTAPACIEVAAAITCEFTNIYFSGDIPADKAFSFGAGVTGPNTLILGKIYPPLNLATAIKDAPSLIELGVLNSQMSNIKVITTDLYDAAAANDILFIPLGLGLEVNGARVVSAYLIVEEAIVDSFTLKAGRGATYDQLINQTFATGVAVGVQKLTNVSDLAQVYPKTYQYRAINTSATSGKFRLMFIMVN